MSSTGDILQRAHDYQKWLDDNGYGRGDQYKEATDAAMNYGEGHRDGKAEALRDVKVALLSQRPALTVVLSTGEYINLEDVLDIITTLGESKVAAPTDPERRAKDGDR
jgi:hypothetical protein